MNQIDGMLVPQGLDDLLPAHTALLVYDMQVGICSQISDGVRIVQQCARVIAAARARRMRIVYTQHLSCPRPWMGAAQYRTAMAWQRTDDPRTVQPWFPREASGSAIVAPLAPHPDDLVLQKYGLSAFEGTPLQFALRDSGLTGIALCGIALEIGIEPTVRHAGDLGFIPILIEDACGSGNPEAGTRCVATLRFLGDALLTNVRAFCEQVAVT